MGQASAFLRNTSLGFMHYCPACDLPHFIATKGDGPTWSFNDDVEKPTFGPSVKVTYEGKDAGQDRGDGHKAPARCCHYFIKGGVIEFCGDSSHELAGRTVALPELPPRFRDGSFAVD